METLATGSRDDLFIPFGRPKLKIIVDAVIQTRDDLSEPRVCSATFRHRVMHPVPEASRVLKGQDGWGIPDPRCFEQSYSSYLHVGVEDDTYVLVIVFEAVGDIPEFWIEY